MLNIQIVGKFGNTGMRSFLENTDYVMIANVDRIMLLRNESNWRKFAVRLTH